VKGIDNKMNVRDIREHQAKEYLLGELTEAEQARLEERFFQDAELSELLTEIEDDLIDQYVRKELSPRERERFETHFLISERRREKTEFARSWLEAEKLRGEKAAVAVEDARTERPASRWKSVLAALSAPRPALAYSLGAFALLFLLFGLWQWSEMGQLRKQMAEIEAERQLNAQQQEQLRRQADDERQRSDELEAQKQRLEQELAQVKPQADNSNTATPNTDQQSAPLAFILSPSVRASEAPRELVIPRSAQSVRLQLNIDPGDRYPAYQARLQTASGTEVRSWSRLSVVSIAGRLAIFITVPAKSLSDGQYELTLSGIAGPDRKEDLGYYYFNLRKE
jgi:hypothetical protein